VTQGLDKVFAALADPTRRRVFEALIQSAASVSELAATMPVTRSAVSQHLGVLLDAGLVEGERSGRHRIYRARPQALQLLAHYAREPAVPAQPPRSQVAPAEPFGEELAKWQAEAPHIDPSALALLMYFAQIGQYVLSSNDDVAAGVGLRFSDITVLGALRRLGPPYESTPTQLARTFWITLPGMTKRLTRLEAMGLIRRRPDPDDGRGVLLRLTPKGLSLLRKLVAEHQPPEYHALLELSAAERRQLGRLLSRLLTEIDRLHDRRRPEYAIRTDAAAVIR
jgi:DNA-binding MarR family transcriptional regulator